MVVGLAIDSVGHLSTLWRLDAASDAIVRLPLPPGGDVWAPEAHEVSADGREVAYVRRLARDTVVGAIYSVPAQRIIAQSKPVRSHRETDASTAWVATCSNGWSTFDIEDQDDDETD